jgi:hypothetical protein
LTVYTLYSVKMASSAENSILFQELKAEGKRPVNGKLIDRLFTPAARLDANDRDIADLPKFELESYISNYDGMIVFEKLHT